MRDLSDLSGFYGLLLLFMLNLYKYLILDV